MSLTELKVRDKNIHQLIEKYDKTCLNCDFNAEQVYKQLNQTIKSKCIKILELLTGQDINSQELSDSEIQNRLKTKLDQISDQMMETQALTQSLDKKFENYQKVWFGICLGFVWDLF